MSVRGGGDFGDGFRESLGFRGVLGLYATEGSLRGTESSFLITQRGTEGFLRLRIPGERCIRLGLSRL